MNKLVTVIMAFRNEGDEVSLTCKSARDTAGDRIDIICVDDCSDDGRDYESELSEYNVRYYRNIMRMGSSQGKETGVSLCKTPYFIILDAHCRFYTKDWLDIVERTVLSNPDTTLYCCGCQYFYSEEDHQNPKHTIAYGAYFTHQQADLLRAKWNVKKLSEEAFEIPVILGANYIGSKQWWQKINGHRGLILYGREEEYVSLKCWLMGGKCMVIPSVITGHKGRSPEHPAPFRCLASEAYRNEITVATICAPEILDKMMAYWDKVRENSSAWDSAKKLYNSAALQINLLKQDFEKNKVMTFTEFDRKINYEFKKKIGKIKK